MGDDMPMRLPNLIVAGVGKSGTTSLFSYLAQHPNICASTKKELNYFTSRDAVTGELAPIESYAGFFSHCAQNHAFRLEASPSYCYGGTAVITALRDTLRDPRIVMIIREPTSRLWSAFTYLKSMGVIAPNMTFDSYVDHCEQAYHVRRPNGSHTPLSVGFYIDWLPEWLDMFGDDCCLLFADDLFADPRMVVQRVCEWLRLSTDSVSDLDYQVRNDTIQPRSHALAKLTFRTKDLSQRWLSGHPAVRAKFRDAYRAMNARPLTAALKPRDRQRVAALYREPNARLARDLSRRGYRYLPPWLGNQHQGDPGSRLGGAAADHRHDGPSQ
ncbi:MAG: sulfotransferase domain-containing protein [Euzebyales bacterium]|nr:sulfotransferase domain-containing protein [Euzebyales bacterium]